VAVVGFPDEGGGVTLFDWQRQEIRRRIPSLPAGTIAIAPDGATLATGYGPATAIDATTGSPSPVLESQPFTVNEVAYGPDGSLQVEAHATAQHR
jgi:hypothetical protein